MHLPPLLSKKPPPPTLNCTLKSRHHLDRVKRDLFNVKSLSPEAKEDMLQECHEHAEQSNRVRFGYTDEFGPSQRWNFDFENCRPVQSDNTSDIHYQWKQVMPSANAILLSERHRPRMRTVSPEPVNYADVLLAYGAEEMPKLAVDEPMELDATVAENFLFPPESRRPFISSTFATCNRRSRQTTMHDYVSPADATPSKTVEINATPNKIRKQPSIRRRVSATAEAVQKSAETRPITDYFPVATSSSTSRHVSPNTRQQKRQLLADDSGNELVSDNSSSLMQKPVTPQAKEKTKRSYSATPATISTPTTRSRTQLTKRLLLSASSAIVDDSSNSCSNDAAFTITAVDEADADRVRRCLKYTPPKRARPRSARCLTSLIEEPNVVEAATRSCTPTSAASNSSGTACAEEEDEEDDEDEMPLFATPVPVKCGSLLGSSGGRRVSQSDAAVEMSPSLLYSPSSKCMH